MSSKSAKTVKKNKRKSQAPVALVYFVTMLLFLGIIGGFAVYLLKSNNIIGNDDTDKTPKAKYVSFTNLYARVNGKGGLSDATVIKFRPTDNKIIILPISPFSQDTSGDNKTFSEVFAEGGVLKLRKAIERVYKVDIDHYATVTPAAFDSCIDIFGGFSYTPPEELYHIDKNNNAGDLCLDAGKAVTVSGREIRIIATYPLFSKGRLESTKFMGLALTETLNNAFRQPAITSDNMDNLYSIITANSETDIDKDVFKFQRSYIRDMLKENITPCESIVPDGKWIDDTHFKPSDSFVNEVKKKFSEKGKSSESSSTSGSEQTSAAEEQSAQTEQTQTAQQ